MTHPRCTTPRRTQTAIPRMATDTVPGSTRGITTSAITAETTGTRIPIAGIADMATATGDIRVTTGEITATAAGGSRRAVHPDLGGRV